MPDRPDDPPPEAAKAVPLTQAFREHADPELLKRYRYAEERLQREGKWQYVGNPRNPDGYVLSEFDGHGRALLEEVRDVMAAIEAGFVAKLRRGDLTAWARVGSPLAPWREIPASAWSTLQLDDVVQGTAKGGGLALYDIRVGRRVTSVGPDPVAAPPLAATGAPGRPSHMHLIEAEFARRHDASQIETSLQREAAVLAAWFRAVHPDKQPVTDKTIANRLRARFRQAISKQN